MSISGFKLAVGIIECLFSSFEFTWDIEVFVDDIRANTSLPLDKNEARFSLNFGGVQSKVCTF